MAQTTRRRFLGTIVWTALLVPVVPNVVAQEQQPMRDLSCFLGRLRTVDHLPELEASHTAMSSTWDRSGGNADGTDFKNLVKPSGDDPGRNVLLDTEARGIASYGGLWNAQELGQLLGRHHFRFLFYECHDSPPLSGRRLARCCISWSNTAARQQRQRPPRFLSTTTFHNQTLLACPR